MLCGVCLTDVFDLFQHKIQFSTLFCAFVCSCCRAWLPGLGFNVRFFPGRTVANGTKFVLNTLPYPVGLHPFILLPFFWTFQARSPLVLKTPRPPPRKKQQQQLKKQRPPLKKLRPRRPPPLQPQPRPRQTTRAMMAMAIGCNCLTRRITRVTIFLSSKPWQLVLSLS